MTQYLIEVIVPKRVHPTEVRTQVSLWRLARAKVIKPAFGSPGINCQPHEVDQTMIKFSGYTKIVGSEAIEEVKASLRNYILQNL